MLVLLDDLSLPGFHDGHLFLDVSKDALSLDFHLLADGSIEVVFSLHLLGSQDECGFECIRNLLDVVGEEVFSIADDGLRERLGPGTQVLMSLEHVLVEVVCLESEAFSGEIHEESILEVAGIVF